MAGERFHMVQKVSMAVHHIGREPTVRAGPWRAGWSRPLADHASPCRVFSSLPPPLSLSPSMFTP